MDDIQSIMDFQLYIVRLMRGIMVVTDTFQGDTQ